MAVNKKWATNYTLRETNYHKHCERMTDLLDHILTKGLV